MEYSETKKPKEKKISGRWLEIIIEGLFCEKITGILNRKRFHGMIGGNSTQHAVSSPMER